MGLVFMSDVAALVYKSAFKALAATVARFCEKGAVCLFAYKAREVRTERVFFLALERAGVEVERVSEEWIEEDFRVGGGGAGIEVYWGRWRGREEGGREEEGERGKETSAARRAERRVSC